MIDNKGPLVGYELHPVYAAGPGQITTHAFIMCCNCGGVVSGHGGPRQNVICLKCAEHLEVVGALKK